MSVEVSINAGRELQLDISVDTTEGDSLIAELLEADCDIPIDALQLHCTVGSGYLNPAVNSTNIHRSIQLANNQCTINPLSVQSNVTREFQRQSLRRTRTKQAFKKAHIAFFPTNPQVVSIRINRDLATT